MDKNFSGQPTDELGRIRVATEKSDLRWKRAKRGFFAVMTIWGTAFYFSMVGNVQGWWVSSKAIVAPVVHIEGSIDPGADKIVTSIKSAFSIENAPAIVLYIDSPGGSPAEAERINHVIDSKKRETGKKVYAVCGNLCASAGYMIALHADEVFAGRYSLVGSIGAILNTWNFSEAINRFGVQHRAYASGKSKAMLSPYAPVKREDETKAQDLVTSMGKIFAAEVTLRRGQRLANDIDLFTGEVWSGEDAKRYGLVDGIATLDEVLTMKFGTDTKIEEFTPSRNAISFLQSTMEPLIKGVVTELLNQTAFPSQENHYIGTR